MSLGLPAGRLPDVMGPGFHCVRTHWIRGFMAFQLVRRTRIVVLMVPVGSESGFRDRAARPRPLADREGGAGGADRKCDAGGAALSPAGGESGLVGSGQASELRR